MPVIVRPAPSGGNVSITDDDGVAWGAITGTLADQVDLQAELDAKQAAGSYAAASHAHIIGNVTGLQDALDAKLDDTQLDTDTGLAANSDAKIATQKAVKAYVDQTVIEASNSWVLIDQNGADILPKAATITIASPGVVTSAAHGFAADTAVILTTTDALPTGLTAGTIYYVRNPATNTFELSATVGGASINTSGSQSGTHEVRMAASWVWSTNVTAVNFINLAGCTEFLVVAYAVSLGTNGAATVQVSTNNGSTYFTTSGDYLAIDAPGTAVNTIGATLWGTNATAPRYGQVLVSNPNVIGIPKTMNSYLPSTTPLRIFIADLVNDIDALRVVGSAGGNLTGGRIYMYKKT